MASSGFGATELGCVGGGGLSLPRATLAVHAHEPRKFKLYTPRRPRVARTAATEHLAGCPPLPHARQLRQERCPRGQGRPGRSRIRARRSPLLAHSSSAGRHLSGHWPRSSASPCPSRPGGLQASSHLRRICVEITMRPASACRTDREPAVHGGLREATSSLSSATAPPDWCTCICTRSKHMHPRTSAPGTGRAHP